MNLQQCPCFLTCQGHCCILPGVKERKVLLVSGFSLFSILVFLQPTKRKKWPESSRQGIKFKWSPASPLLREGRRWYYCKPVSRVLVPVNRDSIIYLGQWSPIASCSLPILISLCRDWSGPLQNQDLFGLTTRRVYPVTNYLVNQWALTSLSHPCHPALLRNSAV